MTQYRVPELGSFPWQQTVRGSLSSPPAGPAKGDRYLVVATATGAWTSQENKIAWCSNATGPVWTFDTPSEGWQIWNETTNYFSYFNGTSWGNDTQRIILTNPTNLYVSAAGSDSTGDGTSGNPWATLSQALTYLNSYSIGSGVSVIINIGDGTFDWANTTVTHKDANRITITGTNSYAKTISSIQSSSGSAGAYSIILNLNNVTNVVVGDYALISGCTGGTRPETLMGCWAITNVDEPNNRITVASTSKYSSAPSGAVAGTATVVKTVIRSSTAGTNVLALSAGANLANITKIVLVGNSTGRGVSVSNANFTATAPFGIVGCLYGYLIYGNGISGFAACMASGCTYGVYVWSSVARMNNGIFSGNTTGVYFTNSNGECYAIVCGNTTGMDVVNASYVYSATSASVVSYNTGTGMWCHNGSYITAVNSSVANNGTNVSPTADTIANNNSYIQVAT